MKTASLPKKKRYTATRVSVPAAKHHVEQAQ